MKAIFRMFFSKIKFPLIILSVLFSLQMQSFAQKKSGNKVLRYSIIGKWETAPNPFSSSKLEMDFKKDGKFSFLLSSTWKGKYIIQGTKLTSNYFIPILHKVKTDTSTVLIYGDTLVQVFNVKGKDSTARMIRMHGRKSKNAGIIGKWSFIDQENNPAHIEYFKNGEFEIHNVLRSFKGNFLIKNKYITTFSGGRPMFKSKFLFIRGMLYLYNASGSPLKMVRER